MQYLDLGRGEADVALRIKEPTQEDLRVLAAHTFDTALWVSKALAAKVPKKARLTDVPWVGWAPPYDAMAPNPQLEAAIPGWVPDFASDNFLVNIAGAEAGLGGVALPRIRHRFSRSSALVPLDVDLGPFSKTQLFLVCAKSAYDIPRIRLVADLLVAELEKLQRL
jgi:DNA-binding transcriptional LysR family regulator